jgi:hypothetical protein
MSRYDKFLQSILDEHGLSRLYTAARKTAFLNPIENSMWSNMIDGALKGLEFVAIASFDWKLTGIVKLLQSWIKDKREEAEAAKRQKEYGVSSDYSPNYSPTVYY